MISSHVKISIISVISSLSLNCTYIRWCIIETSSVLPRKSSAIFGHLRKFSENFRERSSGLRNNFGNSSENHQNAVISMFYTIKEHYSLARRYEFYALVARTIFHSFATLTREILFLPLEHKIHIFSPPCNILYIII